MPFHFDYEETFPNTDFNKINLDWILQLATQLKETAESGGFDGAPGEPGTATNGIAFITTADTFADIQAAITNGELPVLMYYNMGTPIFMYCFDYGNSFVKFGGLSNTQQLQLTWYSNETKSLTTRTLASTQSPNFVGNPTVPTQEPTNSTTRIANTAFVQNAVSVAIQNAIEQLVIAPFSESFKQALLQVARKVVYIDNDGQIYYDALYNALYPPINVDSITAVWNPPQDYVVYTTTPIDTLKAYLTVTATYDDQTTAVLDDDDYVLSGTLTAGTSVITVTYASATTTFNVTVVANVVESITATFNQGGSVIYETDSLSALVPYLTVTATYTNLNTVYVDYPDYSLSGTLTEGTSTITVSYSGKTDTFSVNVTRYVMYDYIYNSAAYRSNTTFREYVDTGLTYPPSFSALNIEFEIMNSNNTGSGDGIIGANTTNTSYNGNVLWFSRANKGGVSAYMLGVAKQLAVVPADTRSVVKYVFVDDGASYMEYDNTQVTFASLPASSISTSTQTLILAGAYTNSDGSKYGLLGGSKTKLGYIKITDPDTDAVLYNFTPAHDTTTNKYGYYDTVNDVFYPSNGSYYRCANWGS